MKLTKEQQAELLKGKTLDELKEIAKLAEIDLSGTTDDSKAKAELEEANKKIAELEKNQISEEKQKQLAELDTLKKQLDTAQQTIKNSEIDAKELEAFKAWTEEQKKAPVETGPKLTGDAQFDAAILEAKQNKEEE